MGREESAQAEAATAAESWVTPRSETAPDGILLVTGAAGFVGYHLCRNLLDRGHRVVGVDNLTSYYDVNLKQSRLEKLQQLPRFIFRRGDIADDAFVGAIFEKYRPMAVVHLAAQAGVRYSVENPASYIHSNVVGFFQILEACRHHPVKHLVYASSSSVYGGNQKVPFAETDNVDHPLSLYAATKKADELMAYCYSHLYRIPATGLRFFTVYGPYGRPDMAYYRFTSDYFAGRPIRIYNNGDFENDLYRDFTYIDDIVEGVVRLIDQPPTGPVPHDIFNIGNNSPVKLMVFIATLERCLSNALGRPVEFAKIFEPLKPGDVPATFAATDRLQEKVGFKPRTPLEHGLQHFADWFVEYHQVR